MYSLKSPNLFNFREGHQKGRRRQQGGAFFGRGAPTGNVTPLTCLWKSSEIFTVMIISKIITAAIRIGVINREAGFPFRQIVMPESKVNKFKLFFF